MMMTGEKWAQLGSVIGSIMFARAMFNQYFPQQLLDFILKYGQKFLGFLSPNIHITFHEFSGEYFKRSEVYAAIQTYLSDKSSMKAKNLKAEVVKDSSQSVILSMDENEEVTDEFEGVKLLWASKIDTPRTQSFSWHPEAADGKRYYKLTFHKSKREFVTRTYIHHVLQEGKEITVRNRQRKLYTNNPSQNWHGYQARKWSHVAFEHPSTFDTLAMESKKKEEIKNDLTKFSQRKEYYKKIGKAWKRGYLLYGPPGTGKSSMIAAMANFLKYDIYDLELTTVKDNTELRKLLIETTSKSIIVIEDIDCSLDLTGQRKKKKKKVEEEETKDPVSKMAKDEEEESNTKVTLSGLLNFIDGIWSATGGERLIIFTTNHVEKLDPALIRRGRMDKHIELSYCCFQAFKVLAMNYLYVDSHPLFETIGHLLEETNMTPADVAENLMLTEDADTCLKNLIEALETAKEETRKKAEEDMRLKVEKEEKEKQQVAQEDVKVDESLAKEVKENCVEVVKG